MLTWIAALVLTHQMPHQVILASIALGTQPTLVRIETDVIDAMTLQVGALSEGLTAQVTGVGSVLGHSVLFQ